MEPFPGDILLGACFIISILLVVVGSLVLRYRREAGPALLTVAGALGTASSIIWVLIRSDAVELTEVIPLVLIIASSILAISAVFLWRGGK